MDTWTVDRVVLVNNVTALNKLTIEIGRDAVKVINDINTRSSEHNKPRSSQGAYSSERASTIVCIGRNTKPC